MDRKRSFEKVVISVMVGKNVKKFLTFVEDEPDFQGGPIRSNKPGDGVHVVSSAYFEIDTLSLFYLNRGYYNELSFRVLERCHEIASARPNDSSPMRTFTDTYCKESSEKHHKEIWVQFGTLHVDELCKQVYLAKRKSTQSG
ncbi:hypothetical protein FZC27_7921g3518 [Saccharomyces cerevisiae]|nr:hypothetical protein FZC27_7921g3518 [Saccharomyces cerevisiae]